jgi:hypothetical protein
MAVQHLQRSAPGELPVKLAAFVQQFVYRQSVKCMQKTANS